MASILTTSSTAELHGIFNGAAASGNEINNVDTRRSVADYYLTTGDSSLQSIISPATPSLYRNFATTASLNAGFGPPIEFSRGSTATFTGSNGLIQSAANNVPRFDYDPVTLACRGLLIEESRTNLVTRSEEFNDAGWIKSNATVTANATTAPDGTTTADKLVENTSSTDHFVRNAINTTASTTYTYSIYAKAGERNSIALGVDNVSGTMQGAAFTLTGSGSVSYWGAFSSATSSSITAIGNGWYRCSITVTALNTATMLLFAYTYNSAVSYTGNGTSGIFLWGAQLEQGAFATSYIPTTTASVTRAADVAQITGSNFSGMYNQNEGTLFSRVTPNDLGNGSMSLTIYETGERFIGLRKTSSSYNANYRRLPLLGDLSGFPVTPAIGVSAKLATAFDFIGGSRSFSVNGNTPSTGINTNDIFITPDRLSIGQMWAGAGHFNGTLASVAYYRTRLTDAQLQALTA